MIKLTIKWRDTSEEGEAFSRHVAELKRLYLETSDGEIWVQDFLKDCAWVVANLYENARPEGEWHKEKYPDAQFQAQK